MEVKTRSYIYLLASLLIGSFTPVLFAFTKGANLAELLLAAALLSIPVGLALAYKDNKLGELMELTKEKRKLLFMALAAVLMYVPYLYGIAYAERFVSPALAIVIFRVNPLLMLVFLPLLLRERLSSKQIFALSLGFLGIAIGVSGGNPLNVFANPDLPVVGFLLLMALGYALANVIFKWKMLDSDVFLVASGFVLSAFFALLFLAAGAKFQPLDGSDLAIIGYIAVTNVASFYMYFYALKRVKTTMVTNVFTLSTFLTFLWSYLLVGNPVKPYYLAIALLTALGVYVQMTDKVGGSYLPRRQAKGQHPAIFDVTGAFANTGEIAIVNEIKNGGRVLAVKIHQKHRNRLEELVRSGGHANVFTDKHEGIAGEANFVKDVLGAGQDELAVMKAGEPEESEMFFSDLSEVLESPEDKNPENLSF